MDGGVGNMAWRPIRIEEMELPLAVSSHLRTEMLVVQTAAGVEDGHSLLHVDHPDRQVVQHTQLRLDSGSRSALRGGNAAQHILQPVPAVGHLL